MNVFEELIVELQQENLLEGTSIDPRTNGGAIDDLEGTEMPNRPLDPAEVIAASRSLSRDTDDSSAGFEIERSDAVIETSAAPVQDRPAKSGKEFFKKRAIAEVSSLQMVEHVITGVEREYMKVKPRVFDDFKAKMALNRFLQIGESADSQEHKAAEFELMQETEAWCTALAERDRHVQVSSLRQFCENARPALSSQAMLALCRFYRNLPYSESVRSKFDFVITRLFSRPAEGENRVCLFKRDEALGHINTLYGEWSSVPLYAADDDHSKIELTALSFDDLALESENAKVFDELIENDFFGRLRLFKESISELFFAPHVTAAAIEANVRIGNSYVKLIDAERRKMDAESIRSKYGDLDEGSVSDAAGRTLELVELLRTPLDEPPAEADKAAHEKDVETLHFERPAAEASRVRKKVPDTFLGRLAANAAEVNKWFLAVGGLLIAASIGLYVWANYVVEESVTTAGVRVVSLDNNAFLKEHLKSAKVSEETFYGILLPSWDTLSKKERQDYVQRLMQAGPEMGFKQINLLNKDGKPAAYASARRSDVNMP